MVLSLVLNVLKRYSVEVCSPCTLFIDIAVLCVKLHAINIPVSHVYVCDKCTECDCLCACAYLYL